MVSLRSGRSGTRPARPPPLRRAWLLLAPLLTVVAGFATASAGTGEPTVVVTRVDDPITPITADHLSDAVEAAERGGHEALVVELDTPGGLSESMRDIVQDFLAADVPVVVHVTPSGARAASAGALIAWSSHIVAMAPGTTIGAATPVQLEGGEVADKAVEDAAAFARAVAEERGRDIEVAAEAVTEGRALSATEAIDAGVADLIVEPAGLLAAIDGTRVELPDGSTRTLRTADATTVAFDMSLLRTVLQFLADPNIAFLLLSIGTLGIIYELASPGLGVGGGIGVLLILLALVSLSVLPIDAAGLVFLALAAVLFVAELFAPGVGVAAGLGSVSLVLAGLFAFRGDTPGLSISLAVVVPTSVVVSLAVVVAGRLAMRARSEPPASGPHRFVGRQIVLDDATGSTGHARVDGTWWTVRGEDLSPGDTVEVVSVSDLELHARRSNQQEEEPT